MIACTDCLYRYVILSLAISINKIVSEQVQIIDQNILKANTRVFRVTYLPEHNILPLKWSKLISQILASYSKGNPKVKTYQLSRPPNPRVRVTILRFILSHLIPQRKLKINVVISLTILLPGRNIEV